MEPSELSRPAFPAVHADTGALASMLVRRRPRAVRLLELEPRIAGGLAGQALATARDHVRVPYVDAPTGVWGLEALPASPFAVLVGEGKLLLSAEPGERGDVALVGPGDVLDPSRLERGAQCLVIEPARLALLDSRFQLAARAWPHLVSGLAAAIFESSREHRRLAATIKLPRIEDRMLGFMALAIARWGTVRPDGLVISLPVTHETLGRLVGARRPTVSLALADLERQGRLRRPRRGWWSMDAELVAELAPLLEDEHPSTPVIAEAG